MRVGGSSASIVTDDQHKAGIWFVLVTGLHDPGLESRQGPERSLFSRNLQTASGDPRPPFPPFNGYWVLLPRALG
jgi:hypothetical protein